jgi:Domain of unknown function (DUF4349)
MMLATRWGFGSWRIIMATAGLVLLGFITACSGSSSHNSSGSAPEAPATATADMSAGLPQAPEKGPAPATDTSRDIVKTASVTVTAADTSAAADKAATIATDAGGRVDSRSEDAGSDSNRARVTTVLRVPVAKLDGVIDDLKELGAVQRVEITSDDVTATRVDLDARITALQTSVDRLLGIMRDAKDPEALIRAEEALSQRQADLDSLRAQRSQLGEQIAYSTVTLDVLAERVGGPVPQEYHGFFGQVERGWDALVSAVSSAVLAFGLLLPWLAALAVAGGVLYGLSRLARSRKE